MPSLDRGQMTMQALTERAAKQWKDFAVALLVLLMMRHFLRRHMQRREVAEAALQLQVGQREHQEDSRRQGLQEGQLGRQRIRRYRIGSDGTRNRAADKSGRPQGDHTASSSGNDAGDGGVARKNGGLSLFNWLLALVTPRRPATDATAAKTVSGTISVSAVEIAALRAKAARLDATSADARCVANRCFR